MKRAASNIAWRAEDDAVAADLLLAHQFTGVEIAPTRVWADPLEASVPQIKEHRKFWESRGLPIVALQSLLFGHPELTIFETPEIRQKTETYLTEMIMLASELGAGVLVFGSPKNRLLSGKTPAEAQGIAIDFFRELGQFAARYGIRFSIETQFA